MKNDKLNEKLDFSDLSTAELTAVSISYENSLMKTDKPVYPYTASLLETLTEESVLIAKQKPEIAIKLAGELNAIAGAMCRVMPAPPLSTPDDMAKMLTAEELKWHLVNSNATTFVSKQLTYLVGQIIMALESHSVTTGESYLKH
ncbi:hypothetical protein RO21_11825 [[Actinobacillus] muris]|uniref:Uncharacterized protein n=1 Tax=Muribacter muris TaxID=67855 RepID=A0A0J5P2E4_9PAST|nr:hypothetical protein [Muribacter muris]KMK50436.1 hypothetical protein RO21_11825 [[Actinobacillus] muris] [Muribacter muris]